LVEDAKVGRREALFGAMITPAERLHASAT
jgi:hypothetical protein